MSFSDDLASVPWADLGHAYGPATDTPDLLRALLSEDAETREQALFEGLWPSICHQGSIYTASAPAVPFLIRLLNEGPAAGRADILGLLDGLASRDVYAPRDTRTLLIRSEPPTINPGPPVEITINRWHESWSPAEFIQRGRPMYDPLMMQQAHAAAREGIPVYLALLEEPGVPPDVLRAALRLLSAFREAGEPVVSAFAAVLDEAPRGRAADERVEAEALFGLGALLLPGDPGWERFRRLLDATDPAARPAARYAAATALATYFPAALPAEGEEALIAAMLAPDDLDALELSFGEAPRSVRYEAYQTLGKLGAERGSEALARALARGYADWHILYTLLVAEALLDTAFFSMPVDGHYRSVSTAFQPLGADHRLPEDLDWFYGTENGRFFGSGLDVRYSGYVEAEAERIRERVARDGVAGLSATERRAVAAVVACEPVWLPSHNLMDTYGLPKEREALRALLEGDQARRFRLPRMD